MNQAILAALAPQQLGSTVGKHLIHVHVGLGAGACLPDRQRKLEAMTVRKDFPGSRHDRPRLVFGKQPKFAVYACAGEFYPGQGMHDRYGHALAGNVEVLQGTLCLGTPQMLIWNLDGPQRISLVSFGTHRDSRLLALWPGTTDKA